MEPKFFPLLHIGGLPLLAAKGHFATQNSHINYFIDTTVQKYSLRGCEAVAHKLSEKVKGRFPVDSILCMDGTSTVGTCLAKELSKAGGRSLSEGSNIYIVKGELNSRGELIFRDNARFMLEGKHVLILTCSLTTGTTALRGKQSVEYYGGRVVGVASIYAAIDNLEGLPVVSVFDINTIPDYVSYSPSECPMCKRGEPIDAVVNTYGFSKI